MLAVAPTFAEARYNRAAYRLRQAGPAVDDATLAAAAEDLRLALSDGEHLAARAVLEDPDFAAVLDRPAFAFLPHRELSVSLEAPPATAFWGAEVDLRLRLQGEVSEPVTVDAARAEGPLELVSVVEDAVEIDGEPALALQWTWRVVGAGPVAIGPLTVHAGGQEATAEAIAVEASAPPDRTAPSRALTLALPSTLFAAVPMHRARAVDGALVVHGRPGDRVELEPPGEPAARYERREAGVATEIAWRWPSATPSKVTVRDGSGALVFSGAPGD
ncbi:MAG: hypothetical protein R3F59_07465 [Myxococcota bacterium]